MNDKMLLVGLVKKGKFYVLAPKTDHEGPTRLTTISMVEAVAPEGGEIDPGKYEGEAIAVRGHGGGDWIYSADVVDQKGPIVSAIMAKVFGREDLLMGA